ncbi:ethanolaminephosphotransferase 1 isoform X2 [Copidosoma floridanum]|nr:ethanolaminephosphotransferase 1 isoform X2 [Copidosoma floridanum]
MFSKYDYYYYASNDDMLDYPSIPKWIFAMAAFNIFMAYTLDGIDGKQARRTQTSGPLGELFDHGLDSWTAMLITTCMFSVFGRTDFSVSPTRMYFILWNVFVTFYLSHWEKYNTGVLFLPWGYDASMVATIGVFILSGIAGNTLFKFRMNNGISSGMIFEMILYISALVSSLPVVLLNIYKSYVHKTGKMRSFSEALRPLVPLTVLFVITTYWVLNSPSKIIDQDPRIIFFTVGTIFSNICCRLIVAQMSNTRCEILPWILFPVAGTAVLSFLIPRLEFKLMYLLAAIALTSHVHYGSCVVRQMCRHFRIDAFKIKDHSQ